MISVVLSTYQRGHLLARSLECYAKASLPVPLELVIVDDGSTDDTQAIVERWARELDITYIRLWKQDGLWRDCASVLNRGIRAARGELVAATHPEVLVGRKTLEFMWDARAENVYLAAKIYYLTPENQELIDTVPWREQGALAVRRLPDFYASPSAELRGHDDYTHEATDRHTNWESWVFGAMLKSTWRTFGGFRESGVWGAVDVDFLTRRRILGIKTDTLLDPRSICVHQNHDRKVKDTDVLTPRDMSACVSDLVAYPTPESARLGHI